MNKKFLFFIIITSITVFISVRYTADLKKFYIETWYLHIKKITPETALKKARLLYKKKEYTELMDFCSNMMLLYPENREFRGLAGMTSLKLGNHLAGAQLLLSSIENPLESPELFKKVIVILFKENHYGDITAALSEYPVHHDTGLLYIYGVSLLSQGEVQKGLRYLQQSEERGNINYEVYYYLGFAHHRLGNTEKAREHLEEALRLNPLDNKTRKLLVATYSKLKQYKKAERLLRRGM